MTPSWPGEVTASLRGPAPDPGGQGRAFPALDDRRKRAQNRGFEPSPGVGRTKARVAVPTQPRATPRLPCPGSAPGTDSLRSKARSQGQQHLPVRVLGDGPQGHSAFARPYDSPASTSSCHQSLPRARRPTQLARLLPSS